MEPAYITPFFDANTWQAIAFTLQLAACTTFILLFVATPIAWWLSRSHSKWTGVVGALVTLPLVLPPTVLGFYLLLMLGPNGPIGYLTTFLGWGLWSFSFTGLLIGSVVYSLPFAVQPIRHAFEGVSQRSLEVAATLRASPWDTFCSVVLPLARSGFYTAAILSFAHTIGEFGIVLMIGGNIPGKTQVISTLIYDRVEAMEYTQAHWLAGGMVVFSFMVLLCVSMLQRKGRKTLL